MKSARLPKESSSLRFKFSILFIIFAVIAIVTSGIETYTSQAEEYEEQCLQNIRNIGDYLESIIQEAGEEFVWYQNYYMNHYKELNIPYGFSEYLNAQRRYENMLVKYGISIQSDTRKINPSELPAEVQEAYCIYLHEYYLLTFENARKAFGLPYTYYLVPREEIFHMVYMIDGERTEKNDAGEKVKTGEGNGFLYLGDEYYDDPLQYKIQWDSWLTGQKQDAFQMWDNEWGQTYAYYTPLIINGTKYGLIGTELEVKDVIKPILKNTFDQILKISIILIVCIILVIGFINHFYISKIKNLESNVRKFTEEKNPELAEKIRSEIRGNDEISSLAHQFASMIVELKKYMITLLSTSNELKTTREHAKEMHILAHKDALTGVRNKNAYDREVRRLELQLAEGKKEFGIAMIDLNFLKQINDTYGHEYGNESIRKLCHIICHTYSHSPVFRIGGDEFVVILENDDYKEAAALAEKFNGTLDELKSDDKLEPWEKVSAALGCAMFDSKTDTTVSNVFNRADKAMYARKKAMKGVREV